MANHTPPIQGFMLEVAATRLTPEKLALLNYKLATCSPTAAQIMACIKPGEWESATGDTRQFNDIRLRLEAAIDAWVDSNPTSKGFVWPPQATRLNLTDAAAKLSKMTTDSTSPVAIIRAGAAGKIPVYWFNDLHLGTYIADITDSKQRDLSGTYSDGPQQMNHTSLRELSVSESLAVFDFAFTEDDFTLLEKIKGKAVDGDGNLLGYRHPATQDGTVTVTHDQLFVYAHDLTAYAATLAPDTVASTPPAPKAAAVDQVQVTTRSEPNTRQVLPNWSVCKPERTPGYRHELVMALNSQLAAGALRQPGAHQILDVWKKSPPIGFSIGRDDFTYNTSTGKNKSVTLRSLQRAISELCTPQ